MLKVNQLAGFGARRATIKDTHFANVVLLMHCDGADGSTTFVDVKGHALTASGTAEIDTSQSVFGGACGQFGSGSGYVSAAASADWNFGTGDFTIECRVRFNSTTGDRQIVGITSASNNDSWAVFLNGGSTLYLGTSSGSHQRSASWSPATDTWYAVAVAKAGGNVRFFVDGAQIGSAADTSNWGTSTDALYVGREFARNNNSQFDGRIDELRITKGVGRYTGAYTVATAAFPNS